MTTQQYTDITMRKIGNSEYEISGTIPADVFAPFRARAISELGSDVEVPGFRKGNVPEKMLVEHIGEQRIMERAGNLALSEIYPKIVVAENISAIGSPQIQITKLAKDNPLEFTATTAVMPEVTLPDYQRIAADVFSGEDDIPPVTDEELEETLTHIRRQRAQIDAYEKQKQAGAEQPTLPEIDDTDLPELTDEFVQTLGDFPTVDEFKEHVRSNILEEKKHRAREKKRIEAVEKIIEASTIELPELLVDQELKRIQMQMESDIAQSGTKVEDYLKNIDKTMDDLRKEWRPEAEKRAKLQLILNKIASAQEIEPEKEDVEKEIKHVLEHYPQAQEENVRVYVETTKRNEQVFQWLESQGE